MVLRFLCPSDFPFSFTRNRDAQAKHLTKLAQKTLPSYFNGTAVPNGSTVPYRSFQNAGSNGLTPRMTTTAKAGVSNLLLNGAENSMNLAVAANNKLLFV